MRPRFSLLSIVLLMAIAALSLVVWRQYAELLPLRDEVVRLRVDAGILTIVDPERIAVIPLAGPFDALTWRWRIFLPKARQFTVYIDADQISISGQRNGGVGQVVQGGEYLLTACIREQTLGTWIVSAHLEGRGDSDLGSTQTFSCPINPSSDWVERPQHIHEMGLRAGEQRDFRADKPVELLRMWPMTYYPPFPGNSTPKREYNGKANAALGLSDGFILWIEDSGQTSTSR